MPSARDFVAMLHARWGLRRCGAATAPLPDDDVDAFSPVEIPRGILRAVEGPGAAIERRQVPAHVEGAWLRR